MPLIARVNGACVAGGMGLMALCDLAVAAEHCKFGLPKAKVGVFPMQVLVYLRRMTAPRHLNELCLCGDLVDARRAGDIGLVSDVVPSAQLDGSVDALVARISACSPVALRRGKAAIRCHGVDGIRGGLELCRSPDRARGSQRRRARGAGRLHREAQTALGRRGFWWRNLALTAFSAALSAG